MWRLCLVKNTPCPVHNLLSVFGCVRHIETYMIKCDKIMFVSIPVEIFHKVYSFFVFETVEYCSYG